MIALRQCTHSCASGASLCLRPPLQSRCLRAERVGCRAQAGRLPNAPPTTRLAVIGVVPYVGLNFAVYGTLKDVVAEHQGLKSGKELSVPLGLACGGVAGASRARRCTCRRAMGSRACGCCRIVSRPC